MATINLGNVGLVPKGTWIGTTPYVRLEVVEYNGSSYVALGPSTNVTPGTDSTKWQLLAQAGARGQSAIKTRIDYTASETTPAALAWDTVHVWPEISSLTFTLAASPNDGYDHEIVIQFDTPSDITNFNLGVPSTGFGWGGDIDLTELLKASTRYEICIRDSSRLAVFYRYSLATE